MGMGPVSYEDSSSMRANDEARITISEPAGAVLVTILSWSV